MKTVSLWMLLLAQPLLAAEPQRSAVDGDGTVHMPAFAVPLSRYMSEQAKRQFIEEVLKPPAMDSGPNVPIAKMRAQVDDYYRPLVERAQALYPSI